MGDANVFVNEFQARAASLLNNKKFSDLEIHVKNGNITKIFWAHKLFLAMSSEEFAMRFYGSSGSPSMFKIVDFKPQIVYLMLQFLYTNDADISNTADIKELYKLAKKFAITDLENYCYNKSNESISIDNIFEKYDFALSENITQAVISCRSFVSMHTKDILKHPKFCQASQEVVEDILKLDILSVESELQLLESVINWAEQESLRKSEMLRICLYPLFKHIRFLTLSPPEFFDFVENHEDILNGHESSIITMALLQTSSDIRWPSGFCDNSNPREFPDPSLILSKNKTLPMVNLLKGDSSLPSTSAGTSSISQNSSPNNKVEEIGGNVYPGERKTSTIQKEDKPLKTETEKYVYKFNSTAFSRSSETSIMNKKFSSANKLKNQTENKVVSKYPTFENADMPHVLIKRPIPLSPKSILKNQTKAFEFPLLSMEKTLNSAFDTDINCSAVLQLYKGNIELNGIELRVKSKSSSETIKAYLTLSNSSGDELSQECENLSLENDICVIPFTEPQKLLEGNNIKIEVLVEELALNRCLGCNTSETYHFNCGLNVNAKITLNSNKPAKSPFYFYMINRILYMPC